MPTFFAESVLQKFITSQDLSTAEEQFCMSLDVTGILRVSRAVDSSRQFYNFRLDSRFDLADFRLDLCLAL